MTYLNFGGVRWDALRAGDSRAVLACALLGDALPADELTLPIRCGGGPITWLADADGLPIYDQTGSQLYAPDDPPPAITPDDVPYGSPADWYRADGTRISRAFRAQVTRQSPYWYLLTARGAASLLAAIPCPGGMYTGQLLPDVLTGLIGSAVAWTLDPALARTQVYGWLPWCSTSDGGLRRALQHICFATGAVARQGADGGLLLSALDSDGAQLVPPGRTAAGGSVEPPPGVTGVDLTAYSYTADPTADPITLYDGELTAQTITTPGGTQVSGALVLFARPVLPATMAVTGAALLESGVNYAVLSGGAAVTLTGVPYGQQASVYPVSRPVPPGAPENRRSITGETLVTPAVAATVAARCASWYCDSYTVRRRLLLQAERPGDRVTLSDVTGAASTGWVERLDLQAGARDLIADCTLRCGYTPPAPDLGYVCCELVTSSGAWIAPSVCDLTEPLAAGTYSMTLGGTAYVLRLSAQLGSGALRLVWHSGLTLAVWDVPSAAWLTPCTLSAEAASGTPLQFRASAAVKAVLVGGAPGGGGGAPGSRGLSPNTEVPDTGGGEGRIYADGVQAPAPGGAAGGPGTGGNVLIAIVPVSGGDTLTIAVGAGGEGGAAATADSDPGVGAPGSPTTLTAPGGAVLSSASGGVLSAGYTCPLTGVVLAPPGQPGVPGGDGGVATLATLYGMYGAGDSGASVAGQPGGPGGAGVGSDNGYPYSAGGGGGGGAAYGAQGNPGGTATTRRDTIAPITFVDGGDGGAGASALPPPAATRVGEGGSGGNGGGAGGNAGGARAHQSRNYYTTLSFGGNPGAGSAGASGATGGVMIYF